ncbi:MAG TPA: DUF692 domain-containing protein [Candidatus Methylomirabilis sp.]|nr:DUF692 domain-containing protein [Candidatus Methylomirabilis sp.]
MTSRLDGRRRAGIGLRGPHVAEIMASRPPLPWLEVHAENYMGGGSAVAALEQIRGQYPVSVHGVGLSLGTADGLDRRHLSRLRALVGRIDPWLVSEHLSWSTVGVGYLNHLLPLPYTEESLDLFARHVEEAQEAIGRRLLIENPSGYLRFRHSPIPEPEFLAEVARRTGCGLLCDVNNIFVTASNLSLDAIGYLDALPRAAIGEIHLAGHTRNDADGQTILIDDHGSPVSEAVWQLYAHALRRLGPIPTLIEWDTDLPALGILIDEAWAADRVADLVEVETTHALAR